MILAKKPVTIAEVNEIVKNLDGKQQLKDYLKRFTKLKKEKALHLADEIHKLNNAKIKTEDITKIVDFLPQQAEELNKIFRETTLTEEETNAILEIVKKY